MRELAARSESYRSVPPKEREAYYGNVYSAFLCPLRREPDAMNSSSFPQQVRRTGGEDAGNISIGSGIHDLTPFPLDPR